MTKEIENKLGKVPILNVLVSFGKKIKIPGLNGMSLVINYSILILKSFNNPAIFSLQYFPPFSLL